MPENVKRPIHNHAVIQDQEEKITLSQIIPINRFGNNIYPSFQISFKVDNLLDVYTQEDGNKPIDGAYIISKLILNSDISYGVAAVKENKKITFKIAGNYSDHIFSGTISVTAPIEEISTPGTKKSTDPSWWNRGFEYRGQSVGVDIPNKFHDTKINSIRLEMPVAKKINKAAGEAPEEYLTKLEKWINELISARLENAIRPPTSLRNEENELARQILMDWMVKVGSDFSKARMACHQYLDLENIFLFPSEAVDRMNNYNQDLLQYPTIKNEKWNKLGQEFKDIIDNALIYRWATVQPDADATRNQLINGEYIYIGVPVQILNVLKSQQAPAFDEKGFIEQLVNNPVEALSSLQTKLDEIDRNKDSSTEIQIKVPVSGYIYDVLE
jgi:hypothetical protein